VHGRYKDLAKVERGFKTIKTGLLEVRPIWLRRKNRTQAHVFICMLAYLLARQIEKALVDDETITDALRQLDRIASVEMMVGSSRVTTIPTPPPEAQSILELLNISLSPAPAPRKTKSTKVA